MALLTLYVIACPNAGAFAADNARLLVYLEVPRSSAQTSLALGGLDLVGGNQSIPLPLLAVELDSADNSGNQILLTTAEVMPGFYESLHLEITGIEGRIGVAEVTPDPDPGGLSILLNKEMRAGYSETVFLVWRPASVDPEEAFHVPDISAISSELPPLGSLAFVTSKGSESVVVINRMTGRVAGALRMDKEPRGMAYSRINHILFVAMGDRDAIAVVDVMSLRVINMVPLQFGDDPSRLLVSQDEATLFVLCPGSRTLMGLAAWSLQQQFRVPVGDGPRSLAQDPVTGFLYVACEEEGRILVVDPRSGAIQDSLAPVSAPVEIVIDPQSRVMFVAGSAQRVVRALDLVAGTEGGNQNLCGPAVGLAVNPRTRRLYASIPSCRQLSVVRPDLGIEFGSVLLPSRPGLMAFDQEYRQLWVVLPDEGRVAVCNVNRGQVEYLIEVGSAPYEVLAP